jgi:hypothetical protein
MNIFDTSTSKGAIVKTVFPLIFFAFVAFIWWFPVLQNFSTQVAGTGGDPYQTLWRFTRLGETVRSGSLTVPEEASLRNLSPLPWMPVFALFGPIVAYNVAWFAGAILAGWFAYLLARAWGAQFWPATAAGLLLEFSPYRLAQSLGHFGAMQIWILVATLLCVTLWIKNKKNIWLVIFSVLVVLTAWTDHQLFIMLMGILIFGVLFFWRVLLAINKKQKILAAILLAGAIFLGVSPFLSVLGNISKADNYFNLGNLERERFSASWRKVFLPAPFSLWRGGSGSFGDQSSGVSEGVQTLGIILPLACIYVFAKKKNKLGRKDYFLLCVAAVGFILAFGPSLQIRSVRIPLPGALAFGIPVLSAIRTVGRFIALPVLLLPIFFARNWRSNDKKTGVYFFVPLLFCLEIIPVFGFPMINVNVSGAKAVVPYLESGKILAIPANTNYVFGSEQLYASLFYGREVVGNSALSRIEDPEKQKIFVATPVIRDLLPLRLKDFYLPTIFGQTNSEVARLAFVSQSIGNIVLAANPVSGLVSTEGNRRHLLSAEELEYTREFLKKELGMREREAYPGFFVYNFAASDKKEADYFVAEGTGWNIIKKEVGKNIVEIKKNSELYLFARNEKKISLMLKITDAKNTKSVHVNYEGKNMDLPVLNNGIFKLDLSLPAKKFTVLNMELDGDSLMVENPQIGNK